MCLRLIERHGPTCCQGQADYRAGRRNVNAPIECALRGQAFVEHDAAWDSPIHVRRPLCRWQDGEYRRHRSPAGTRVDRLVEGKRGAVVDRVGL